MKTSGRFLIASLVCLGGSAMASSPDAWSELWKKSEAACRASSRLNEIKVGPPVDFEASVLRVVSGRHPQPHMKNAPGTVYCLYDKKSGKAQIAEPNAQ